MPDFQRALELIMHPEREDEAALVFQTLSKGLSDRERELLRDILRELTHARREAMVVSALDHLERADDVDEGTALFNRTYARDLLRAWRTLAKDPLVAVAVRFIVRNDS